MDMQTESQAWERVKGETRQAYGAFHHYLMLGERRSLSLLSDSFRTIQGKPKPLSLLKRWSSKWFWQDRCAAYDDHLRRQTEQAQSDAHVEMAERHIADGIALQRKGMERLQSLIVDAMSANEAIRCIVEGIKLERLARGEPSETQEQESTLMKLFQDAHERRRLEGVADDSLIV